MVPIMREVLNSPILGLLVVIPTLLLLVTLQFAQSTSAIWKSFRRLRWWLAVTSVVFVAVLVVVVVARFVVL